MSGLELGKKVTKLRMSSKLNALELALKARGILKDDQQTNVQVVVLPPTPTRYSRLLRINLGCCVSQVGVMAESVALSADVDYT